MDERLRFVARLLDGEKMAALCREFDISRKTGYKIFQRYKDCGLDGLTDRSRRPYRHANRLPFQIEKLIVQLKRGRPSWGAPKIREKLRRLYSDIQTPAISTVGGGDADRHVDTQSTPIGLVEYVQRPEDAPAVERVTHEIDGPDRIHPRLHQQRLAFSLRHPPLGPPRQVES